jgi:hypothetical protein
LCVVVDSCCNENIWWCVNLLNLVVKTQIQPNLWWAMFWPQTPFDLLSSSSLCPFTPLTSKSTK